MNLRPRILTAFLAAAGTATGETGIDFARDIRPILANHCFECHGPDEHERKADLRFDTKEGAFADLGGYFAVVPGKPEESELIARIHSHDKDEVMPPAESTRPLKKGQKKLLEAWIREGAEWEDHWAFTPLARPEPPEVSNEEWCRNEIDYFVLAKLDELGWKPQPEASRETLARRASLDLTGLPPSLDELDSFLADKKPGAYERYVDRLFASTRYGEHMAWAWMDAGRYADTDGYQADSARSMWRWRDWLINRLNANVPFDQLTREMLAGDLLIPVSMQNWESGDLLRDRKATDLLLATAFLRNHRIDRGSGTRPAESKFENAADRMETVGTAWMGLTLKCAKCHDHKFDPLPSREYYQLLAYFDKVPEFGQGASPNSHPYIYTPTEEERREVEKYDAKVKAAQRAFAEAEGRIAALQGNWEKGATRLNGEALIERGLVYRLKPLPLKRDEMGVKVVRGRLEHRVSSRGIGLKFDGKTKFEASTKVGQYFNPSKKWTLAFRLNVRDLKNSSVFHVIEDPDRDRRGIQVDVIDGKLRIMVVSRWNHSLAEFWTMDPLDLDKGSHGWGIHVAISCDGRRQGLAYKVYLDGKEGGWTITKDAANDSNGKAAEKTPLVLGANPWLPGFKGVLGHLLVYDRVLDPREIAMLAETKSLYQIIHTEWDEDRTPQEEYYLRHRFLEHGAPDGIKALQQAIFDAERERDEYIRELPTTMAMQDKPRGKRTHVRRMGIYDQLGDIVSAGTPAVLPPMADGKQDRLALANWLVSGNHPLTGRVAVNRLWQQVWGRGLVDSPENFGTQCARPEYMELMDWLAAEYALLGWDTKKLLKSIVTSAAYRQSSNASSELWEADPANRMLARGPRHRLSGPVLRDQALHVAGLLNDEIGGPPVTIEDLTSTRRGEDKKSDQKAEKDSFHRRTVYAHWKRNSPPPSMVVFDANDRSECTVAANRTNTPLQALASLNQRTFLEAARFYARCVLEEGGSTDKERLNFAFRSVTAESPSPEESRVLMKSLKDYRGRFSKDKNAAAELIATELSEDEPRDPVELAAWTALANVLLNMDRVLVKE